MIAWRVKRIRGGWRVLCHGIQVGPDFSDELIAHAYKHNCIALEKAR